MIEKSSKNIKVGSRWKLKRVNGSGSENTYVVVKITTRGIHFQMNSEGYTYDYTPGEFIKQFISMDPVEPELFAQLKSLICMLASKPNDLINLQEEIFKSGI